MRTTEEAIEKAKKDLKPQIGDDECYHSLFDDILQERLRELDPKFMKAMESAYKKSRMSRWCA